MPTPRPMPSSSTRFAPCAYAASVPMCGAAALMKRTCTSTTCCVNIKQEPTLQCGTEAKSLVRACDIAHRLWWHVAGLKLCCCSSDSRIATFACQHCTTTVKPQLQLGCHAQVQTDHQSLACSRGDALPKQAGLERTSRSWPLLHALCRTSRSPAASQQLLASLKDLQASHGCSAGATCTTGYAADNHLHRCSCKAKPRPCKELCKSRYQGDSEHTCILTCTNA